MTRIVIIDHETHHAFIEDIPNDILESYKGDIEAYIKDNYTLNISVSWDTINSISYIGENGDTMDVEPTEWL